MLNVAIISKKVSYEHVIIRSELCIDGRRLTDPMNLSLMNRVDSRVDLYCYPEEAMAQSYTLGKAS